MAERNLEHAMAEALLKRYLAGEALDEALLDDLERALRTSPELLAEAQRISGKTLASEPAAKTGVLDRVKALVTAPFAPKEKAPAAFLSKPGSDPLAPSLGDVLRTPRNLALSAALAVVLILMSTAMRNPTAVLGARAASLPEKEAKAAPAEEPEAAEKKEGADSEGETKSEPAPEKAKPEATAEKDPEPEKEPEPAEPDPAKEPSEPKAKKEAEPAKPEEKPVPAKAEDAKLGGEIIVADPTLAAPARKPTREAPPVSTPRNDVRPTTPRRTKTRRAPRREHPSGIRVYDEQGRPKN